MWSICVARTIWKRTSPTCAHTCNALVHAHMHPQCDKMPFLNVTSAGLHRCSHQWTLSGCCKVWNWLHAAGLLLERPLGPHLTVPHCTSDHLHEIWRLIIVFTDPNVGFCCGQDESSSYCHILYHWKSIFMLLYDPAFLNNLPFFIRITFKQVCW